jgi:hypothetical protein
MDHRQMSRPHARLERGAVLAAAGIWFAALVAIVAIAVEVARLTNTATEVQVAADAGALGAATAIGRGQIGQAIPIGKSAAAANYADGRTVKTGDVQIDIGRYDPDPAAAVHFDATCTPGVDCTAARATVTLNNVRYITASLLNGQAGTGVQKNAVAAAQCQGSAYPIPLAVCSSVFQSIPQGDLCGSLGGPFFMNPNGANNACWTSLSLSSANKSTFLGLLPPQCGGNQIEAFVQHPTNLQNGVDNKVWQALQCCIACQNVHDFTVPVVDCGAMGGCNTSPLILGFASIHINSPSDIDPPGSGNTQCNSGDFSPWGCQLTINNGSNVGINASQVCQSDLAGKPGGGTCTNFGNTVVTLGQLP